MAFALAIVLILLSLTLHELGHAFAMRCYGIPIREIGLIGFKVGLLPSLRCDWLLRRWFPGTDVYIHPLVLGAYVKPTEVLGP